VNFYTEIIKDSPTNRGNIFPLPKGMSNHELDYFGKEVVDGFNSIFLHDDAFAEYVQLNKSVKGYVGRVFADHFVWDFDSVNVEEAQKDAIELCDILYSKYNQDNVKIFFSGNKGFHVLYMSPELLQLESSKINTIVRAVCINFAEMLPTFDLKIYDTTRIFRTPNSKHPASGLYKIPLTYDELSSMSIEDIKQLATQQRKLEFKPNKTELNTDIVYMLEELENNSDIHVKNSSTNILDGIINGFKTGDRNTGYCSVAGLLHSRGIDTLLIHALLKNSNDVSANPISDSELDNIIKSISRYPVKSEFKAIDPSRIKTFKDAGLAWKKLIQESGTFSFGNRYPHINEVMNVTLLGDLIGIVAASGVGKSTLLMDMMNEYSRISNCHGLMLSLEMSDHACFFRGAQIAYKPNLEGNVDSKELAGKLLHDEDVFNQVVDAWDKIVIVDETMSINQIEDWVCIAKDKIPSIRMIGIDYLQFIQNMTDITESMKIARELKDVMKRNRVFGINAIQTNKSIINSFTEVNDNHIEGAQAIKQAHDYLLYFWHSTNDSRRVHGKFGKTRWAYTNKAFDLVRDGLLYHSEDYIHDVNDGGL